MLENYNKVEKVVKSEISSLERSAYGAKETITRLEQRDALRLQEEGQMIKRQKKVIKQFKKKEKRILKTISHQSDELGQQHKIIDSLLINSDYTRRSKNQDVRLRHEPSIKNLSLRR